MTSEKNFFKFAIFPSLTHLTLQMLVPEQETLVHESNVGTRGDSVRPVVSPGSYDCSAVGETVTHSESSVGVPIMPAPHHQDWHPDPGVVLLDGSVSPVVVIGLVSQPLAHTTLPSTLQSPEPEFSPILIVSGMRRPRVPAEHD